MQQKPGRKRRGYGEQTLIYPKINTGRSNGIAKNLEQDGGYQKKMQDNF